MKLSLDQLNLSFKIVAKEKDGKISYYLIIGGNEKFKLKRKKLTNQTQNKEDERLFRESGIVRNLTPMIEKEELVPEETGLTEDVDDFKTSKSLKFETVYKLRPQKAKEYYNAHDELSGNTNIDFSSFINQNNKLLREERESIELKEQKIGMLKMIDTYIKDESFKNQNKILIESIKYQLGYLNKNTKLGQYFDAFLKDTKLEPTTNNDGNIYVSKKELKKKLFIEIKKLESQQISI